MIKPDLFIVGAPRCGTTAMHALLNEHPQIFMSRLKEPHYFGSDLHRLLHFPIPQEEYLALFADAGDVKRVGESSTSYLHSKLAAGEIQTFNPDAHIVIMLRDPVDMVYSYHAEHLNSGFETIFSFEEALEAEAIKGRIRPGRSRIE